MEVSGITQHGGKSLRNLCKALDRGKAQHDHMFPKSNRDR